MPAQIARLLPAAALTPAKQHPNYYAPSGCPNLSSRTAQIARLLPAAALSPSKQHPNYYRVPRRSDCTEYCSPKVSRYCETVVHIYYFPTTAILLPRQPASSQCLGDTVTRKVVHKVVPIQAR